MTLDNTIVAGNTDSSGSTAVDIATQSSLVTVSSAQLPQPDRHRWIRRVDQRNQWQSGRRRRPRARPQRSARQRRSDGNTRARDRQPGHRRRQQFDHGRNDSDDRRTRRQRGPTGLNAGTSVDIGAYEASSSYLVTTTGDSLAYGTLRSAVNWANFSFNDNQENVTNPAPNTIRFDTSNVFSTAQTITLTLGTLDFTNTGTAEAIAAMARPNSRSVATVPRKYYRSPTE